MRVRPDCIVHWSAIEGPEPRGYKGQDEPMGYNAAFSPQLHLGRLGIHHRRVPPGQRISYPHAESAEEEFVYVLEGTPDVWLDGHLHRLAPGDAVGFPAGTGVAHTFLNNSDTEVRLLVVGEANKDENRIVYPVNPEREAQRDDWWHDAPARPLGPHDGRPDPAAGRR